MAQRQEIVAVYAAGIVQGVALVTFPAVSAILASLLGAGLARRLGGKWMLLGGLGADLAVMTLLLPVSSSRDGTSWPFVFC